MSCQMPIEFIDLHSEKPVSLSIRHLMLFKKMVHFTDPKRHKRSLPMLQRGAARSHKAILIGEANVGKTSILMRFHHELFLPEIHPTVGASFIVKRVQTEHGVANLEIWDTAGQELYRSLVPMYCRGADIAIVVFDLTNQATFLALDGWLEEIKQTAPPNCAVIVAGNKADLAPGISAQAIVQWAESQTVTYHAVSALTGDGITDLFKTVADCLRDPAPRESEDIPRGSTGASCC
jgi:Ras-related protein Rab-22